MNAISPSKLAKQAVFPIADIKSRVSHSIEDFAFGNKAKKNYKTVQGDALLKTSSDKYKKKFLIIMGNELYIQRNKES